MMHRELLLKSFNKVKEDLQKESGVVPSDTKCAEELSVIISKTFTYGEKSIRTLYKSALKNTADDIEIKQPQVLLALARYLGYDNYSDFVVRNKVKTNKEKEDEGEGLSVSPEEAKAIDKSGNVLTKGVNKYQLIIKIVVTITLVTIVGFFIYNYFNQQPWMIWKGDHYEKVSFDAEKVKSGELKIFNEEHYEHLKKIIPNCETQFFNPDGSERVWYGKSKIGELEYFTGLGRHPETGKTLKPITQYMIDKYICNKTNKST